jgi:hypothetical protein
MWATFAPGDDMVEILSRRPAVLAARTVAGEDRTTIDSHPILTGDVHVTHQPDHRGLGDCHPFRSEYTVSGVKQLGFGPQYQKHRPTRGHDAQWLEGGVENQCPPRG